MHERLKSNIAIRKVDTSTPRDEVWITVDIIIPIYDEEAVLPSLFERLSEVFSAENLQQYKIKRVHYILIDDGSKDGSAEIISDYIKRGGDITLYRFTRNFGHQNAVSAGLDHSDADVTGILDADLQDPPEILLQMVAKWREGFDVVYGERKKRKENPLKVFSYWLFYRILSFLAEISVPHDSGDFSLMDRKVVEVINGLPEKLKYHRVLRAWVGFSQIGFQYERHAREAGETKYSLSKLFKLAADGIASASVRPLRLSQFFGFCYLIILLAFAAVLFFKLSIYIGNYGSADYANPEMKMISDELALWFLFTLVVMIFGAFVQVVSIYMLSAYMARGYLEIKARPSYLILEAIGNTTHHGPARDSEGVVVER